MGLTGCASLIPVADSPRTLVLNQAWPHDTSDLLPDPATDFGVLPNGVRYILKENQTPRDRVSMHLYIQSGSLAESEGEEGIAHFLEHMLFEGSIHFEPGELVKYFQRIGMQFGPDANAHTGFGQTVYDILIPKGDPQSISEGLLVLNDFAKGALLSPEQVQKEKNVILAEKRASDSAQYRTMKAVFQFEMPESLPARRLPIGEASAIINFDARMLRQFYDTWYRPERIVLVMVGAFDKSAAKKMIEKSFADMRPRAKSGRLPDFGHFSHQGIKAFYYPERESGAATVRIETIEKQNAPADTTAYRHKNLLQRLAEHIVQKRLDKIMQDPDSVFISASIGSGDYLQQIRYREISAESKPEKWQQALTGIEQSLRGALTHGFTDSELQRAKADFKAALQRDVNEMATRDSKDLSQEIMDNLNQWQVYQSAQQQWTLLGPMIETASLEDVHQAFRDLWSADHRLVLVTGNAWMHQGGLSPSEQIVSAYDASNAIAVDAREDRAAAEFPYLSLPAEKGTIRQRVRLDELGVEQIEFDNGLRLILKRTAFKKNEVLTALSFGGGRSSEPYEQPGLAVLSELVVNGSGFGSLDRTGLDEALAGRLADISLDVREETFVVNGQADSSELPLLFQLMNTFVQDPGYRADALKTAYKSLAQHYRSFDHRVEGMMQVHGEKFLAGGDSRFGWPSWQNMQQLTIEHIKQWFGDSLKNAPLELAIVGDFEPEAVIELARRYLGSLTPRTEARQSGSRSLNFPAGESLHLAPDSEIEKALVAVVYPTADFWNIHRTRRLNVLAELLSEELRVHIREKMGAAYSPYAYHHAFRAYSGYGLLQAHLLVDPAQIDMIAAEVKRIAGQMASQGISADQLRRVLDPTLVQIKDLRQSNMYWLNSVLAGASRHPEQLAWARTMESDYRAISVQEINTLAKQYLDNQKAATIVVVPGKNQIEK
ncbi:MAG: hypothetical protein VR64_05800 [Desulfatitalea sp. BRH_c12]|nr:MAG: hypothetical protein VR64_05800 [Desulfatitalea sp. BRH_c12]